MFLRNYWYAAATSQELSRALLQRWIIGEPVLLYRRGDGTPAAVSDVCPHRSYPLSMGELDGDNVRCLYHGLTFAPDGRCVHIPGQAAIAEGVSLPTYPAVEKWRLIWLWMGDPALADETTIPDFHWNDDPEWHYVGDHLEIGCNYLLLTDNLLDLSHETFVHASTIGNLAVAETPASASTEGEGVIVERRMEGCPAPPFYVKLKGYTGEIDRMQKIRFDPPANIVIESRSMPMGANDSSEGLEYRVLNAITPGTEAVTHHFWSVPRNFAPEDEVTKVMYDGSVKAFSEDVVVLEAQQEMLEKAADRIVWTNVDVDNGGLFARRIVSRLLKAEGEAARTGVKP